jgi:hypothetical protein
LFKIKKKTLQNCQKIVQPLFGGIWQAGHAGTKRLTPYTEKE